MFNGMEYAMSRTVGKQHKVIDMIIKSITIYMMNNFFFKKIPTNMFFHYKSMFKNITLFSSERMFRRKNINIFFTNEFSTFPFRIFISSYCGMFFSFVPRYPIFTRYCKTLSRTILRTASFYYRWICSKFFSTNDTLCHQWNFCFSSFRYSVTFHRAIFRMPFANIARFSSKYFTTNYTFNFWRNFVMRYMSFFETSFVIHNNNIAYNLPLVKLKCYKESNK